MEQPRVSPYRWVIEGVMLPLQIAVGLSFIAPSPLFPFIMDEYGLSKGTVSLLIVATTIVVTAFVIPGGIIVSKLGSRKAIAIGGFLVAAGTLAAVAPNFWTLVALRVAYGMGVGILLPAIPVVAGQWFALQERPFINGLNLAGQGGGVAVTMFFGVPIANALGWQTALALYGAFGLVTAVLWLILARTPPAAEPSAAEPAAPPLLSGLLSLVKNRNVLLLSLAGVGPFGVFVGFTTWLPTYYNEVFGMPLEQAASLVGIIPAMGVVVNLAGGLVLARLGLRKPVFLLAGLLLPLAALGSFLIDNTAFIAVTITLMGLCFWIFMPTMFTIAMELPGIAMNQVAIVTGVALTAGNLATVITPYFVGGIADATGSFVPGLLVVALLPLLLVVAAALLPETGPKAKPARAVPPPAPNTVA